MTKKIFSIILCFILLIQASAAFAASYDFVNFEDKLYDDGVDEANGKIYYVAGANTISRKIKFSMDMGLIGEFAPNASVTKQNAKDALRLIFGADVFYEKYYRQGKEDEALTVDEAIILFTGATGYGKYLEFTGKTDISAYRAEAKRRGLLDGVDYNAAKQMLTAEMFYTMFYNTLDAEMFGGDVYSSKGVEYRFTEDTLMEVYLGFKQITGVVTANTFTSVKGSGEAGEGRVRIGNDSYECAVADTDDFLGYTVEAYADKDNVIRTMAVDEKNNETMIFDSNTDIKDATNTSFTYYDDKNKEKTIKLNPYVNVVYNNAACPDFKAKDYKVKNGYVKFIDNNRDNVFDVALVNEYYSFMPYIVYDNKYIIEDLAGNSFDLTKVASKGEYKGMKDLSGKEVTIDMININTPVSVLTVYGTKEVTELIFLEENTYEGIYSGYSKKDDIYKIGDREFKTTEYFKAANENKFPHTMGNGIIVYLDHFGKIIKSANIEDLVKYGYVTVVTAGANPLESVAKIKMFTENDKWEIFDIAENLLYNNRKIKGAALLNGGAKEVYDGGTTIAQLVKYRVNTKGEVVELDTANKNNMAWGAYRETDDFQLNYGGDRGEALKYYAGQMQTFGGKYRLNKAVTKVFNIPTDMSYTDYFRMGVNEIYNDNTYTVNFFDVNENYTAGAICIYRIPTSTWVGGQSSQGRFIIDTGQHYNLTTGEVEDFIALSSYDWETSAIADDEICKVYRRGDIEFGGRYLKVNKFTDLRRGDIVELSGNYDGRITAFMVNFAVDHEKPLEEQTFEIDRNGEQLTAKNWWGEDLITFAKVVSRDVEVLILNADKESNFTNRDLNRIITPPTSQKATIYMVGEDRYEYGTLADIQVGDFVLVEMNEITLKNLVVYRP